MTDKIAWRNMSKSFGGRGYYIGKVVRSCCYNLMRWPDNNGAGKNLHAPNPADFFERPNASILCQHIDGHLGTVAICRGKQIEAILHIVPGDVQTLRPDGNVALYGAPPKGIDLYPGFPFVVMNRAGQILCSSLCAKGIFVPAVEPVHVKKGSSPVKRSPPHRKDKRVLNQKNIL